MFVLLSVEVVEKRTGTTVSDILIEQITAWGVKCVFGIPETSTLDVMEAIRKNAKVTQGFNFGRG
jgi:hypothetical protein